MLFIISTTPRPLPYNGLKGQCHEIFASGFFLEPVSPKPLIIPLGPFRKFAEIFVAQGLPPVLLTPVANGKNLQAEKF